MVIVWRLRGNIIRTALCWIVWHKMFTVSSTLIWAVLTGPTDWVCHIGTLTLCIEAVALSCITVTWWSGSGVIQAWSRRPTGFLQYFDTVGLVIWPVKIVPEMTYYVSSGTLNPTHSVLILFSSLLARQDQYALNALGLQWWHAALLLADGAMSARRVCGKVVTRRH